MRFRSIAVLGALAIALAVNIWAQGEAETGVSIHKPSYSADRGIPYEPDRIFRMTLHDYVGARPGAEEHETTGRYVTFGLPMKYLNRRWVFPDQSPAHIETYTGWELFREGTSGAIVNIHAPDGVAPPA